MAVNFRNRVKNVGNEQAGNYEGVVYYSPYDMEPSMIRKSQKNW